MERVAWQAGPFLVPKAFSEGRNHFTFSVINQQISSPGLNDAWCTLHLFSLFFLVWLLLWIFLGHCSGCL
jgi:hypothetical protein